MQKMTGTSRNSNEETNFLVEFLCHSKLLLNNDNSIKNKNKPII